MLLLLCAQSLADQFQSLRDFGSNPGDLRMWFYQPEPAVERLPLVVALHGCRQKARDYAENSGWRKYAALYNFNLLLPEQKRGWLGNNPLGCFNWYYRGDQAPGGGEALSIKQAIDALVMNRTARPGKIFITGFSAGAAMTAAVLAGYPDTFAGGAIIAGVPYGCAKVPDYVPQWWLGRGWSVSYVHPFRCMEPGIDLSPAEWGSMVRDLHPDRAGAWPVVSIWHGTRDAVVAAANAGELVEQWTNVHGLDPRAARVSKERGFTRFEYTGPGGRPLVELYLLDGLGHGQPIKPGGGWFSRDAVDQCGSETKYMHKGPLCASYLIARFWGLAQ